MDLGGGGADLTGLGIVGCGSVAEQYVAGLSGRPTCRIVGVADLDPERSADLGGRHDLPALGVDELLAADGVDVVVNLTPPRAHCSVSTAAVTAGKSVFSEKPLATSLDELTTLLDASRRRGALVGCAPDTVLSPWFADAEELVTGRRLGSPVAAEGAWYFCGHEHWHPDPDFFYRRGGGPLLDMGPYWVAALVALLGPVSEVSGITGRRADVRTLPAGPRTGETIPVEVATHVAALLSFEAGATGSLVLSYDAEPDEERPLTLHLTGGMIEMPPPHRYGGRSRHRRSRGERWIAATGGRHPAAVRGAGVLELVAALRGGHRRPRTAAALAAHVLDVLLAVEASTDSGRTVRVEATAELARHWWDDR